MGDDDGQDWNEQQWWQGKGDSLREHTGKLDQSVKGDNMMVMTEMNICDDKENVILVLVKFDGSFDLNKNHESSRSELV